MASPSSQRLDAAGTSWLRHYPKAWLGTDLMAGLTSACVVIPKAMAYATVAGLPLQVGLYTAFVPMIAYALLGSSRPLSVSSTSTLAILVVAAFAGVSTDSDPATLIAASATLTCLVGLMLLLAGALRLGFVANFISEPVLIGFKAGIGLVIIVDQIPKLFGFHIHKHGFLRDVATIVEQVPQTSIPTLLLAAGVFAAIFLVERYAHRLPAPLVAIAGAIAATVLLGLPGMGVETVGKVPSGLPPWTWPRLDLAEALWPAAAGIALMSFTESIAAARAFSAPEEPQLVPNRELLALGVANTAGSVLGAMPAGGGTSQTAVNRLAGARTQLAELVTAAIAVATMLLLAPVIALMPQAALAAIVIAYSIELVKPQEFVAIRRVRRVEFRWAVIAFVGVILLGTLKGILIAIIASMVSLAYQAYNPPVYALGRKRGTNVFRPHSPEHPDDETWPGLLMVRSEGRAFFANAHSIGDSIMQLAKASRARVIVLDFSGIMDIEYTALRMLISAEERLREAGIQVWVAALNRDILAVFETSGLTATLGRERMFFNLEVALNKFQSLPPGDALPQEAAST
jgi:high affinity sulfate transporter 1